MGLNRTRVSGTVGATGTLTAPLSSDYVELIGFKATAVGDTSAIIKLTDGAGRILFLDAGTIDYTTAKDRVIALDDTVTGLTSAALSDSTGAAATISGGQGLMAKSPLIVDWSSGTAGDTLTVDLYYRFPLWAQTFTIPVAGATATQTQALRSKYAQIIGFKATIPETTVRVQIADADSRVVYLDAADKNYSAGVLRSTLTYDDTLTGLTPQQLDATGVAATATSAAPLPVVRSPITVSVINDSNTETAVVEVFYRAG